MDWKKTKTILIITLLLINLGLIGVLFQKYFVDFTSKNERLSSVMEIYRQRGIQVDQDLLDQPLKAPKIDLTYEQMNHKKLSELLMIEEHEFNNSEMTYESENYRLQVLPDSIIFSPIGTFEIPEISTPLTPEEQVNAIILEMGFSKDYVLVNHEEINGRDIFEYTQVVDNYYLEDTYMKFIVEKNTIMRFERKWYSSLSYKSEETTIVPIDRMLFQLLVNLTESDKDVKNIELVYRLESTMSNVLLSGEATPYFRITFSNGAEYYEQATKEFYE